MQSNSEMLADERRARLLVMASSLRSDLARNTYPNLSDAARRSALESADRWETEANQTETTKE